MFLLPVSAYRRWAVYASSYEYTPSNLAGEETIPVREETIPAGRHCKRDRETEIEAETETERDTKEMINRDRDKETFCSFSLGRAENNKCGR